MKILTIKSKRFGEVKTTVDDIDFARLNTLKNLKWCVVKKRGFFYFQKRLTGLRLVELHRWIMGEPIGFYVDHISRDTLDNRRINLRVCTNSANIRNGKIRSNNTSGFTGVYPRNGLWRARIRVKYKTIQLGGYKSFKKAVNARKNAEKKYFNV